MKTEEDLKGLRVFLYSQKAEVYGSDSRAGYRINIDCMLTLINWLLAEEEKE